MSMFDSYDNLSPDYIPNNSVEKHTHTYAEIDTTLPRVVHNAKGTKVGVSWNHGEEFDLYLDATPTVKVLEDSLVYRESGAEPNESTKGYAGQQAYNTYDRKSWTCVGEGGGFYIWKEDRKLVAPDCGTKELVFRNESNDFLVSAKVYNFRWELIYQKDFNGANTIVLPVNKEFNDIVNPGTYYCTIVVTNEEESEIVSKHTFIVL